MSIQQKAYDIFYYTIALIFIISLGAMSAFPALITIGSTSLSDAVYTVLAVAVAGIGWYYGNRYLDNEVQIPIAVMLTAGFTVIAAVSSVGNPLQILYSVLGLWLFNLTVGLAEATYNHGLTRRHPKEDHGKSGNESAINTAEE